jgi:AcrR family transcriptional regulator
MPATRSSAGESSPKGSYHHGNLREALVEAAIGILAAEGPTGLGLRCAARAAGVSAAAPYHHFGSKEGLLAAVAAEGFRRLTASQAESEGRSPGDLAPRERISRLGRTYVRFARTNPELYQLMFGRSIEDREAHPELVEAAEGSYEKIEAATLALLADQGNDAMSPKLALNGGWAIVHGLSTLLNDGKIAPGQKGNPEEDQLIESLLEVWCRGLEQGLGGWSPSSER